MAVDVIDQVLELFPGKPVYCFHEIVHNKHVVGRFRDRGVVFVDDLHEVPSGAIVVFSAHGVSPAIRQLAKERNLMPIDATCPLVTKVHAEAVRYARQGYQILLVGHKNHQEVIGTTGEAPDATQVVESPEDIPHLTIRGPRKNRVPHADHAEHGRRGGDHRCAQAGVSEHQGAAQRATSAMPRPTGSTRCGPSPQSATLCSSSAARTSSNCVRLTEISENCGTAARLLDDVSEIDWSWFPTGNETVLLTAGASARPRTWSRACAALLEKFGGDDRGVARSSTRTWSSSRRRHCGKP